MSIDLFAQPLLTRTLAKILLVIALLVAIVSGTLLIRALIPQTVQTAAAQTEIGEAFSSGSVGSDGPLILPAGDYVFKGPCSVEVPPSPPEDNVCNFTEIHIQSGATVKLSGQYINGPVYWLATGNVQIDGIVDLNGSAGHNSDAILGNRKPAVPGAGGYGGGVGQRGNSAAQSGGGPGRGWPCTSGCSFFQSTYPAWGRGTGAGYSQQAGSITDYPSGLPYGNTYLVPIMGGSGGGGGRVNTSGGYTGGGGGGGGGAILIASSTSITTPGIIRANGGNGGAGAIDIYGVERGGGAGGSGGAIFLMAPIILGNGTLSTTGGVGVGGLGTNQAQSGSSGRIRLEAFQQMFTGASSPTPVFGSPIQLTIPTNSPSVKVVSVDTGDNIIVVPGLLSGEFDTPDVSISTGSSVTLTIEAHNIPVGERIQLFIIGENSTDQVAYSTPLNGTFTTSTATIVATIPFGPSRMFLRSEYGWSFYPQMHFSAGDGPQQIAQGYFNSDGWVDIATTAWYSNQVSILLGNGDGTFQPRQFALTGTNPTGVAVADLNNNGTTDMVVTNYNGSSISVFRGMGDGSFILAQTYSVGANPAQVKITDINGNGIPDLIVSIMSTDNISVFLGTGDTNLSFSPVQNYPAGDGPGALALGDFNEDGKTDVAVTNYNTDSFSILLGTGLENSFFLAPISFLMANGTSSIATTDLNGDGHLDIVVANNLETGNLNKAISVRLGNGLGAFQDKVDYASQVTTYSLLIGDVTSDGIPDIIGINTTASHGYGSILVWEGNGNGTFQKEHFYLIGDGPTGGALADFNGDGLMDFVVANQNSDDISVLLRR